MSNNLLGKEIVLYGNNTTGPYNLADRFILTGSDSIFIRDSLVSENLYKIDYENGLVLFSNPLPESTKILIHYQSIPFLNLSSSYAVHSVETETITNQGQIISKENVSPIILDTSTANLEELMVSGSKTLGFSVGSVEGLGIDQATRLNLQGSVAGVEIEAALSDQSSPIPPEGITKEISELDKILINVRKGGWSGSFGDYDLTMPFGNFGTIERQATGAMVLGNLDKAKVQASYSRPKGKYRKITFIGQDGIQGPYQLKADEPLITIVPGSEIIYLDGEEMTRGWNEDYTIDYSLAQVTFTNKRIITNQSRIEINFEYTFDAYDRYDFGIGASYQLSPFSFGIENFQESDNQNQSLTYNLSSADIESLAMIGDDTSKTWLDGGSYVGLGNGDYNRVNSHYVYAGHNLGEYDVTFTFVGDSSGDYVYNDSIYQYVGLPAGNYVAKRHIALPQKNEIYLADFGVKMENGLNFDLAGSMSRSDQNLFSTIGDTNNTGFAYTANLGWEKTSYGLTYKRKVTPVKFTNPMRSPDVDFSYIWGDVPETTRQSTDEVSAFIKPFNFLSVDGGYGRLLTHNYATQNRFNLGTQFFWAGYKLNKIQSILRQNLNLNPKIKFFEPSLYLLKENRENSQLLTFNPGLGINPSDKWRTTLSYEQIQEEEKDTLVSTWQKASFRRTYKADLDVKPFSPVELQGVLGLQALDVPEAKPTTNFRRWNQYFADIIGSYTLTQGISFRIDHHRSNQQTQEQRERFIQVDSGLGDYKRDPETGTFYPYTNGNFQRIFEPTGAISRSQEQEWHGSLDFSVFDPLDLNTLINFSQEENDTSVFLSIYNHDARLGIFPFSQNKNFSIYLENNYNYNLDNRYIGQKDWQNQNSIELLATPSADLNLKAKLEYNLSQQEQSLPAILHRESQRLISLEPYIGYSLALDLTASLGWRNITYSSYNNFQLVTANLDLKRRWQFRKNTALITEVSVIRRAASIDKLPFEINLNDPLGITPTLNLSLDQIISKELVFSASYYFQKRPDRQTEQSLSANFRAYF